MRPANKIALAVLIIAVVLIVFYFIVNKDNYISKPFNKNSLGYKQNNPGNIRKSDDNDFQGEVPSTNGFEAFASMASGYRALGIILHTYITKRSINTIQNIISTFAPPTENNTASYIADVAKMVGIPANQVLTRSAFIGGITEPIVKRLMRAISIKETGGYDGSALNDGYEQMIKTRI